MVTFSQNLGHFQIESFLDKRRTEGLSNEANAIYLGTDQILKEVEINSNNKGPCRKYGISEQTFYNWRNKFGGMSVKEARRLKAFKQENRQLKRLVADLSLDNQIIKDLLKKLLTPKANRQSQQVHRPV